MVKPRKPAPRLGRPPVAAADRRETPLHVLVTKAERAELRIAAASEGMGVSSWVRSVALRRARQLAKKAREEERARQGEHGDDSD